MRGALTLVMPSWERLMRVVFEGNLISNLVDGVEMRSNVVFRVMGFVALLMMVMIPLLAMLNTMDS